LPILAWGLTFSPPAVYVPGESLQLPTNLLFGFGITKLRQDDLISQIVSAPASGGVRLLVTMNLDHVVRLRRDAAFREAYSRAWMVTIDGAPVFAYARAKGLKASRITGADLVVDLARALPTSRRLFFVVSTPAIGEKLLEMFRARGFESDAVAFVSPPFGFERDEGESAALLSAIRDHRTTDLVFGLGAPKSEVWIDHHRERLGDLYAFGFGAGLDFLAGATRRAPVLVRRLGMEWAWRLSQDPVRLWRRYLVDSWSAIPAIVEDLSGRTPCLTTRLDA
jgi:N-acetylglucosaminyldiphosphoundecaprenol N-acetyl-beta-D-mannosaminyltransferase